ncbi:sporulation histidine kinase inhibitor Sda [Bacillaceae bacterium IKA-2]|nr:sporulation histidine kinase inhibitor Sda [Bacillaceae bacterium IKA-2]
MGLQTLSDQLLIESYHKAKTLKLDKEFIFLLKKEIELRNIIVDKLMMTNEKES